MNCPKCNQEMAEKKTKVTNNGKGDNEYKEYKRTMYWCSQDDVWVSVEIPLISPQNVA